MNITRARQVLSELYAHGVRELILADQESPINVSNVMIVCPSCGPVRVGYKVEGTSKVRICKKCGQTLPTKK